MESVKETSSEVKNTNIPRLPEGCPQDFPKGYKEKNGKFYKTDEAGNVTELRNLFGYDISEYTTIDLLYGCTKEYCDRKRKEKRMNT